jgi:hypothetical protein
MEDMTFREARDIAEGQIVYDDIEIIRAAWQFLIDRRHVHHMDDWFQKTARELIELKICWRAPTGSPQRKPKRNDFKRPTD